MSKFINIRGKYINFDLVKTYECVFRSGGYILVITFIDGKTLATTFKTECEYEKANNKLEELLDATNVLWEVLDNEC